LSQSAQEDGPLTAPVNQLIAVGQLFYQRGWSVGTSSNYSIVLNPDPLELLVTASGKDKGRLTDQDFVQVDATGLPCRQGPGNEGQPQPKSSAETMLHVAIAEKREIGCVLHTHSVWATEISQLYFDEGGIRIEGYEMLKGLAGVSTHEQSVWLEIFDNTQDIPFLADQIRNRFDDPRRPLMHAFLIRRHGMYTWGRDVEEARRHVEIVEFLLECLARRRMLSRSKGVVEFPNAP
jgi:methylthioribulose-1-phosphate dehydratase